MIYSLNTPDEVAVSLSKRIKELRLLKKWKRLTLAKRSGVTEASLKRFEQTGKVSFDNFLKLVFALGRIDDFKNVLCPPTVQSIDELEKQESKIPKRGSI